MSFSSKNRWLLAVMIISILNTILFLYVFLFKFGFITHVSSLAIFIVLSLIIGQMWFFLITCAIKKYETHKKFNIFSGKGQNNLGLIIATIHIILFFYVYEIATSSKAQSPLLWAYMAFIDFSITAWFHFMLPLFKSLRITAIVIYGFVGTLFWYGIACCVYDYFNSRK